MIHKKVNIKRIIRGSLTIILLVILLYTSYNAIIGFWSGFHNLDSSFNYINLGLDKDMNTNGQIVNLEETYLIGLNKMKNSFMWICFDIILGIFLGYSLRGAKK